MFRGAKCRYPHRRHWPSICSTAICGRLRRITTAGSCDTFASWQKKRRRPFTAAVVSEFLQEKQAAGLSPYYLKSLRSGMRSLLNFAGERERLRTVRLPPLDIDVWTEADISALVAAVPRAIFPLDDSIKALYRRYFWSTIIPAAWYTGLSQGDLFRLEPSDVDKNGRIVTNRNRTGRRVITWMPPELLAVVSGGDGPFWPPQTGAGAFSRGILADRRQGRS